MGDLASRDERDPGRDRRGAGGGAGDPALPLLDLRDGAAARRFRRRADGDGLGAGPGDLRADHAARHGGGESRLDRDLRAVADLLRLLPGVDPAALAAAGRLVPAADLCVRGDARGAVRAGLPDRLFLCRGRARPDVPRVGHHYLLYRLSQCPPSRRAVADGGVGEISMTKITTVVAVGMLAAIAASTRAQAQAPYNVDMYCRQWAESQVAPLRNQQAGQAVGSTLLGAGLGAAPGAVVGTGAGAANAQNAEGYIQQQYGGYYWQCMSSQGYPPPGYAPPPGYR